MSAVPASSEHFFEELAVQVVEDLQYKNITPIKSITVERISPKLEHEQLHLQKAKWKMQF